MKRLLSKTLFRSFWIDESRTEPLNGEPCFSFKEIKTLKGRKISDSELRFIFDCKASLGVTVESLMVENPQTKTELRYGQGSLEKKESLSKESREALRSRVAAICDTIRNTQLKLL